MRIVPLGSASAFSKSSDGWTCNLLDRKLLIDAAPQALLALKTLGVVADDLEALVITHSHGDHIFGFPFILAERSSGKEPLEVIGPAGIREKLVHLCKLAFSAADPAKMRVRELPTNKRSEAEAGGYSLLAVPTLHSDDSLGYKVTGPDGKTLGYGGDSGWNEGLKSVLEDVDAAMVEMTFIDEASEDHLSLREHLPKIMEIVPAPATIYLTHLGYPRMSYLNALQQMMKTLPPAVGRDIFRVVPVEPLKEYAV
jgi:ribonuclease BN (tRNA processing enzyme)